jgi:hypothetical protein
MAQQATLALDHGITGFCFYYYYFGGKRLLHNPLDNYRRSDIKLPYFLLWANENWTKQWDGGDNEIIVQQHHNSEDDIIFIRQILPIFEDDRYVKIDGKPLLFVYKAHLFPSIRNSTDLWRSEVERAGYPGLYLVMADDWRPISHPRELGFDATYEIPSCVVPDYLEFAEADDLALCSEFTGRIIDYNKFAKFHSARPAPEYKRFRTVMLPWDNSPRYHKRAIIHVNTENDAYKLWLMSSCVETYRQHVGDERLLLIHSWNEWCEGTYLEPDGRRGRRFLEETRDALRGARQVIELLEGLQANPTAVMHMERLRQETQATVSRMLKVARDEAARLRGELGILNERLAQVTRGEKD